MARETRGERLQREGVRGRCPRCRSGRVRHLVIGMPVDFSAVENLPSWADFVGCVHPGYNRRCEACGHTWTEL